MNARQTSELPAWAGLYRNDGIDSIQHYVRHRSKDQDTHRHMRDFVSYIKEYWDDMSAFSVQLDTTKRWDDQQCKEMITNVPWLAAFTDRNCDVSDAIGAVDVSFNACTRILMRYLVLLANHVVMAEWKPKALHIIKSRSWEQRGSLMEYDARRISGYIQRQCERGDVVVTSLWNSLQKAVEARDFHTDYQAISSKVANFCLLAGSPSIVHDPLRDVQHLREHLSSDQSAIREAELRREIEELRKATQTQQRIITNLTFRHLLENLPLPTGKSVSSTARWTSFFKHALKNAHNQSHANIQQHPLHAVLQKHASLVQVEAVGTSLYSTFSTNIHHFSSQYTVIESQWNALESDIMKALTPLPSNVTATDIDWQKERMRY